VVISLDAGNARELLEAIVTAVSVLGGVMAYWSGYSASQAIVENQSPDVLSHRVNIGLGEGFRAGRPAAVVALIIGIWS
jgi:membrane protein YqaA with SNARE-associated domain